MSQAGYQQSPNDNDFDGFNILMISSLRILFLEFHSEAVAATIIIVVCYVII